MHSSGVGHAKLCVPWMTQPILFAEEVSASYSALQSMGLDDLASLAESRISHEVFGSELLAARTLERLSGWIRRTTPQ